MNETRVRNALQNSPNCSEIIEKFLDPIRGEYITIGDLYWWWDSNAPWFANKKPAKRLANILIYEKALIEAGEHNKYSYKKTQTFVDLLEDMQRVDEILKSIFGEKN